MADLFHSHSRSSRLDRVLGDLLGQAPELQAAAVVSFDGLPMASALPVGMDEDRVAAMSAALLSLGERAAENFGRGSLTQVYVEGENGTVFLVSADDEAVLVAVGAKGAKVGLLMFEVRRSAAAVAAALRADDAAEAAEEGTAMSVEDLSASVMTPVAVPAYVAAEEPVAEPADVAVAVDEPVPSEPDWQDEELPVAAPTLHVVEGGSYAEPEPYIYPVPTPPQQPEPPAYDAPYAPYAEQVTQEPAPAQPAGPLSPWGNPMIGSPAENGWSRGDLGSWTNYNAAQPPQPPSPDNWS
jgi:predicted regulator of Ras-like GTPase activity (Roadblock/LC7/MglB family)